PPARRLGRTVPASPVVRSHRVALRAGHGTWWETTAVPPGAYRRGPLVRGSVSRHRPRDPGFATWRGRGEPGARPPGRTTGEDWGGMRVERLPSAVDGPVAHLPRGTAPYGSLTGGLLDRLRRFGDFGSVADHQGERMSGAEFATVVQYAAAGLSRRGLHPNDVVAVLAPVSTARLVSVYTAMAVGCVALPLELSSDVDTLIRVLVDTDARMILTTGALAPLAVELADRSRVRQVVSFGEAPATTPFTELLRPAPRCGGYDPAHCLFDSG